MNTTKKIFYATIHLLALLLIPLGIFAQSANVSDCEASPNPITIKQANGTKLTIIGKGTRSKSWTETLDGYTVIKNKGIYYYAQQANGKLITSSIQARNADERKPAELQFLQKMQKSLKPKNSANKNESSFDSQQKSIGSGPQMIGYPKTGNIRTLLILIKFPNLPNSYARLDFAKLMNQPGYRNTGSFKEYFAASSFGKLNVSTDVYGWYTAKKNYLSYGDWLGWGKAADLVREAIDAAEEAGVDFSQYDNNGDGFVDGVIVAHAGPGAEEGSQLDYIWSHRGRLSNSGGQVSYDGVEIDNYMINPETRLATEDMVGIGIFCHEFGHSLGLPDLYDTDKETGNSNGIGVWSLMSNGNWLGDEHKPGNICAWGRSKLGWITPKVITSGSYSLNVASLTGETYRINTSVPNEYFLVENRKQTGLDVELPGKGMAIWHINTNKTSLYPGPGGVNADENLKGVDLEEADGKNHLDNVVNRGDNGDLFPGIYHKTTFSDATNPSAKLYTGANSGILIKDIMQESGGKIWFTLGNPSPVIMSISPTIETAGSQITITGSNLTNATAVKFNNTASVPFTVVNPTEIKTVVPYGAKSGKITVEFPSVTRYTPYFTVSEYCIPSYTLACTSDYITNFSINTLVNNNSGCSGEANNYKNYAPTGSYTTTLKTGQIYLFTARVAGSNPQGIGIWIDFNNDKDFNDPGEFVYNHTPMTGSVTSQIVIPSNASTGLRRMRVRSRRNGEFTAAQSCQDIVYSSGETEDYTISIGYQVPEYVYTCNTHHIDDVSLNTLQNKNSNCNGNMYNYILYPESGSYTTTLAKGSSYTLRVKAGPAPTAIGVWIDYNNDQDFADAGEFILQTSVDTAATSYTFTLSPMITNGKKRMRVRAKAPGTISSQEYWNPYESGETEDYIINIVSPAVSTRMATEQVSSEDMASSSNLSVYPVPSASQVQIEFTATTSGDFMMVDIFDAQGTAVRRLYEGKSEINKSYTFTVQAQDFTPGIYFVKITSPAGSQTKKMVIIR